MELGIVLAVAAVLMVGVTAGVRGLTRHARASRTVNEIQTLVELGQKIVTRSLTVEYLAGKFEYRVAGTAVPPPGSPTPRCLNLETGTSDPLYPILLENLGVQGGGMANQGKNAYGLAYRLCMTRGMLDVRTCVDEIDLNDYTAFLALKKCTDPCPATFKCVQLGTSLVSSASQRMRYSYEDSLFMP